MSDVPQPPTTDATTDQPSGEELPTGDPGATPSPTATEAVPATGSDRAEPTHPAPTRLSAIWTAVVVAVVLLIALIIFIAENTQQTKINFLWAHGSGPTAVVMLIAAVAGAVIVIVAGIARIIQLRRRQHRTDAPGDGAPAPAKRAPWRKH
jgi:lipopolysaccharide assembly protein A